MPETTATGLFRLPLKIRYKIYEYVLSGAVLCYPSKIISRKSLICNGEPEAPGLFLASKQMHEESIGLYYATSHFRFNNVCRLLDWAREVSCRRTEKPLSLCLVLDVNFNEKMIRRSVQDSVIERLSDETGAEVSEATSGEISKSAMKSSLVEIREQIQDTNSQHFSEEVTRKARELTLKAAKEALQDDINLAAEKVPWFRSALVGKLYITEEEGGASQLHIAVTPQSIITKMSQRTGDEAQDQQRLHRWGPFDDSFLDTTPGPGGLSRRTKAMAKLCGFVIPGVKSAVEEEKADGSVQDREPNTTSKVYADDPFVDTPPRRNRTLKRTDSAVELCGPEGKRAESKAGCQPPAFRGVSPIKRVYPHSLIWENAAVPKFEPSPTGRCWA